MTIYPDPQQCPCCIEGQRPGMYDDGKPASCGGCPHLVSEHARVNRAVDPPSVAADGPERVGEGQGTPGAGTDALRAGLIQLATNQLGEGDAELLADTVLAAGYAPVSSDPATVERIARALAAARFNPDAPRFDVLPAWREVLSERGREGYRAMARAAIAVLRGGAK